MTELLVSPFAPHFHRFVEAIEDTCVICSPYVTKGPILQLTSSVVGRQLQHSVRVTLLTDISAENLATGSTDLDALLYLTGSIEHVNLVYLPRIHAKVYVNGATLAIVTSANLTRGGLAGNLEYGVAITDPVQVRQVKDDVERYAALGGAVSRARLLELEPHVRDLQGAIQEERRSIDQKFRQLTQQLQRRAEDELLRTRVAGRSITGLFADTILYVLASGPLTTTEIHSRVREIHPDMCDDNFDRVIDGEHFGKLWKHHVRNAQQQLKRDGAVEHDSGRRTWRRVA